MPYGDLVLLLAQTGDPISGGAGWVGAGLLGVVLAWIFTVHLPGKDKIIKELITDCDAHNAKIVANFTAENEALRVSFTELLKLQRLDYAESLRILIAANDKQLERVLEALRAELKALANLPHREGNGHAVR